MIPIKYACYVDFIVSALDYTDIMVDIKQLEGGHKKDSLTKKSKLDGLIFFYVYWVGNEL